VPAASGRANSIVLGLGLLALLAGVVVLLAARGLAATVTAIFLLGLSGIALLSLVFLLVGQGEDRDRIRHPHG
jgi:hypothetical protein